MNSVNLCIKSIELCAAGPFEAKDLAPYWPAFVKEVALYGDVAIVERCQIARSNCATAAFSVECVKSYYDTEPVVRATSEMACKAMTAAERTEAFVAHRSATMRAILDATAPTKAQTVAAS